MNRGVGRWMVWALACTRVGHAITLSQEAPSPTGGSAVAVVSTPDGSLLFGVDRGGLTVQRRDATGTLVPGSYRGLAVAGSRERLADDDAVMAAAYDGGVWVVWGDWNRAHELVTPKGIRVGYDGAPIDREAITLAVTSLTRPSDIACTADVCMVLIGESFVRVGADGRVIDAARQALDPPGVPNAASRVVPVRDGWVVTWPWLSGEEVAMVRVARDGTRLDAAPVRVSTDGRRHTFPVLASNGREALLSWITDGDSTTPTRRYVERIESVGAARQAPSAFDPAFPATSAVWNGTDWTMIGPTPDGTRVTRLSAEGTTVQSVTPLTGSLFAARGTAAGFVALRAASGLPVVFRRNDPSGVLVGSDDTLPRFRFEHDPHVDTDGRDFFVGWVLDDDVPVLNRVDASGAVREVAGSTAAPWVGATVPLSAWAMLHDGARASLWAVRPRTPSGVDLESVTLDLTTRRFGARTTWPDLGAVTATARVGEDRVVFANGGAQRVDRRYHPLWEAWTSLLGGRACSAADDGTSTRCACLTPASAPGVTRVSVGRVDRDGRLVDVAARALEFPGSVDAGPQLAYGAGVFRLLWLDGASAVWSAPLAADSTVDMARAARLDDGAAWPSYAPRHAWLSFNGARFVAVWNADDRGHIVAARFAPDGALLDATPRVVVSSPESQPGFAATSNAVGDTLVAWEGSNPAVGAWQVQGAVFHDDLAWPTADAGADGGVEVGADGGDAYVDAARANDATTDATDATDPTMDASVRGDVTRDAASEEVGAMARQGAPSAGACACEVSGVGAPRAPWWALALAMTWRRRRRASSRRG